MPTMAEQARVTIHQPSDLVSEVQRHAWLLWQSVTSECLRKAAKQTADGFWIYNGTMRAHTNRLWPMLHKEERSAFERELYSYLGASGMARCISRRDPTIWHVAMTWQTAPARVIPVPRYRMSHAEKKVTPEEAGETLPPQPVTVTRRQHNDERTPMATATATDLSPAQRKLQREQEAERKLRRDLITQVLKENDEPLVPDEIAFALGLDVSAIRKELLSLKDKGKIRSRLETIEERVVRYGGTARAMRSNLWSLKRPVPPRTQREVIPGFKRESAVVSQMLPRPEVSFRLARYFADKSPKHQFDAQQVAEKTRIPVNTVRPRLRKLCEAGSIAMSQKKSHRQKYTIIDKKKLLAALGNGHLLPEPVEPPTQPDPVAPPVDTPTPTPPVPTPVPGIDLLTRAGEILDENERLRAALSATRVALDEARAGCERLQREANAAAALKVENEQLKAELEELKNQPAVDAATAQRLAEWQPAQSV